MMFDERPRATSCSLTATNRSTTRVARTSGVLDLRFTILEPYFRYYNISAEEISVLLDVVFRNYVCISSIVDELLLAIEREHK